MKLLHGLIAASVLAASAAPALAQSTTRPPTCLGEAVDPAAFGLAKGVVETILPPDQQNAVIRQMMAAIASQMQAAWGGEIEDPGLRKILDSKMTLVPDRLMPVVELHMPHIASAMACAYVREFTPAELQEIAAFARSPAGNHYLSRSTALIADPSVAAANQGYLADVRLVSESFREEVAAEVQDYLAKKKTKAR